MTTLRTPCLGRAAAIISALLALHAPAAWAADNAVATAGAATVTRQEAEALLLTLSPPERKQLAGNPIVLEQWARARLADQLLLGEAAAKQWSTRPEVAAQIEAAAREITARAYLASISQAPAAYPSEAELTEAYHRLKGGLLKPAEFRVSQIFIPAPVDDAASLAAARKQAADAVKQARQPKADLSRLAREYDKSAKPASSDTGWVALEQLLPEVRPVVASLKPGQVSEPVQSAAGLHVLKLVDKREPQPATLDEARDMLRASLRQQRQAEMARAYLARLADGPAVKVDTEALKRILDHEDIAAAKP
ncbi:peptidylprolyl isomerase [Chromobacterium sp. IIBBL 290-4]|uniref:peptidylprolyl isomerase n=1 Tax=Chromobacterium sp. IIBBL 290-4 TaxID=2953890 RepID=UPI0020B6A81C|nr:peptidylprolyl isomerase [Chromobacterium sp. IIBBL 290-4]UTH74485.1 peptidylprolyl isomerase [Chromobacterium sp. IIBBL 290-4]